MLKKLCKILKCTNIEQTCVFNTSCYLLWTIYIPVHINIYHTEAHMPVPLGEREVRYLVHCSKQKLCNYIMHVSWTLVCMPNPSLAIWDIWVLNAVRDQVVTDSDPTWPANYHRVTAFWNNLWLILAWSLSLVIKLFMPSKDNHEKTLNNSSKAFSQCCT